MYMSFNSKDLTGSQITDYLTRVVQPRLQTINGVANAQILGGQVFAMRVWLNPDKMAALGVTPIDVRNALSNNNFTTAAGQVKGDFVQSSINAETSLDNAAAFGKLVVATRGDALVRLDDWRPSSWAPECRLLLGVRWAEGRLHRHFRHANIQSADRYRRRTQGLSGYPKTVTGGDGGRHRL